MKAFRGLYFIDWFCVWSGGGNRGLGPSALALILPLICPPNAASRVSLNVIKAAHGATHLFSFLTVGTVRVLFQRDLGLCEALAASNSIILTKFTALACWALRVFKEHYH